MRQVPGVTPCNAAPYGKPLHGCSAVFQCLSALRHNKHYHIITRPRCDSADGSREVSPAYYIQSKVNSSHFYLS